MLLAVAVALSPIPKPGFCERHELSRFQLLAADVGVSEDELRGLVRRLIATKCGWATPRQLVRCSSCANEFELSTRRARVHLVEGSKPRCPLRSRAAPLVPRIDAPGNLTDAYSKRKRFRLSE